MCKTIEQILEKEMKKIILSKVNISPSPEGVHQETDQDAGSTSQEAEKPPFQPPLPIGPPPPDSPTRIQIKKEILDDGYSDNYDYKVKIPIFDVKCKQEVAPVDPRPMCRRFARGTCTSGSACIFKHEIDVSQLRSQRIYQFCWDYQNKVCTRPACIYVHATIFEEQHYYRTGFLPPSALAHLKQENIMQNKESSSPKNIETKDKGKSSPTYENHHEEKPTLKRVHDEHNICSGHPDSGLAREPLEKKCKYCDKNEYSMEDTTNKMKEKLRSLVRLKEETEEVTRKHKRLYQILEFIMTLKSLLPNKLDILDVNRNPLSGDQIFISNDKENLFAKLLEVAKQNIKLSPDSPSH